MSTTLTRRVGLITVTALLSGAVLVAPSTPAQAATAPTPIGPVVISGLPTDVAVPTGTEASVSFTVQFTGSPTDTVYAKDKYQVSYKPYDANYQGVSVAAVDVRQANPFKPRVTDPASSSVDANAPVPYTLTVTTYTTPGKYRVTVPISQVIYDPSGNRTVNVQVATADVNIVGTPQSVLANASTLSMTGIFSKKARWTVTARLGDYMAGSTVTVWYKAKGKKKFTKIASKVLNAAGDAEWKTKKGAVRKKGQAYFAFSAVPYVGAFQTGVGQVKKI